VSTDNDSVFAGDQLSENGATQKSVVAAAIPITLNLFMTASPSYSFSRKAFTQRIIDVGQSAPQSAHRNSSKTISPVLISTF
jgi:hypothetical protein